VCRYPDLDRDTSPEGILRKLVPLVSAGATIYIGTNQQHPTTFFASLSTTYTIKTVEDYAHLLAWPALSAVSKALIDLEVLQGCTRLVPTFAGEACTGFVDPVSLSKLPTQGLADAP
jgi:hypothetical protein